MDVHLEDPLLIRKIGKKGAEIPSRQKLGGKGGTRNDFPYSFMYVLYSVVNALP